MEDEEIVTLFMDRDETAIDRTAEKYGTRLRTMALRITGDFLTAQECENDTYLEAWKRIPPAKPDTYLPAFLFRIIRNISLNRCTERECLKRKAVITELSDEMEQCIPSPGSIDSHMDGAELSRLISAYLRRQPREKRIIFMHRYFFCDSVSSIAKRFGYSESRIKTMLFRMRNDLRQYLEKEGYTL